MTSRGLYEALLIELNKVEAPSMLLQDFNYYTNKIINQYVNKRYNVYDTNLQTTDDLRVLKSTAIITDCKKINDYDDFTYEITFPNDYLHILNCTCVYELENDQDCKPEGTIVKYPAIRLTADAWSKVSTNYYNRPTIKRPYFYIHHINSELTNPTNPGITDVVKKDGDTFPRYIKLGKPYNDTVSTIDRAAGVRYGNASKVRCEIRCGDDNSPYKLSKVLIDYLKVPQTINLTQVLLDYVDDKSLIIEFPDYVCYEIINGLVNVVLELIEDPRLLTHFQVNQSIASPVQQLK